MYVTIIDHRITDENREYLLEDPKGCEEKHSNTTVHNPVVKPPAAASTAM